MGYRIFKIHDQLTALELASDLQNKYPFYKITHTESWVKVRKSKMTGVKVSFSKNRRMFVRTYCPNLIIDIISTATIDFADVFGGGLRIEVEKYLMSKYGRDI